MEFDEHDEGDEEMGLPPAYDQLGNSSTSRPKLGGDVSSAAAAATAAAAAAASRRAVGATGGGGGSRYRECLKNHAVSIGGHAVDGCGEFMAAGEEGTLDALKCAACNCHRNFHRKETDGEVYPHHQPFSPYYRTPAGYLHVAPHHRPPALALPSTSGGGAHSRDDQDDVSNPSSGGGGGGGGGPSGKKRFRTKFSQEQKDKMLAFAERLGWRIQKHDEAAVQQFCNETSVKRHVLKVWMHNNKHTLGKKP